MLANHARSHRRIAKNLFTLKAFELAFTRCYYALTNRFGTVSLGRFVARKLAKLYCRHIDMNIDPIQQWSGDASNVTLDLQWRTTTLAPRIIPETAGARIHSSCEHERRRER